MDAYHHLQQEPQSQGLQPPECELLGSPAHRKPENGGFA